LVTFFELDICVSGILQLLLPDLDRDGEDSVPEKKKRKTRDISPIEWDKSEGKSEEEEGEEEDGKSDDNRSEKSEDSAVRSMLNN
jgi:hypothetical protein